ncbi:unnamed protein product, partial [marine sediment metagenome]
MIKSNYLKILTIFILLIFIIPFISSCDQTLIDIFTQINSDCSGTRTIDIAVKTEYIQKSGVVLGQNQSLSDKIPEILESLLPEVDEVEYNTFEEEDYTHFSSTINFENFIFLPHISIDNLSEFPLNARMEIKEHFFYNEYFFEDYI